jgi:hypothetical protein
MKGEEESIPFYCPFCNSYINRKTSPSNIHIISKRKAFFLLYKTKHRKEIKDKDLKEKKPTPPKFKDVRDLLKNLRKKKIKSKYTKQSLKEIYLYSEGISNDKRFEIFVKFCKIVKPPTKNDFSFFEEIIISEESRTIVLFLLKFIYNNSFRKRFRKPIDYRLGNEPKLFSQFIDGLTPKQLKYIAKFLIDSFYVFYTKNYKTLRYYYFQYNPTENVIINHFASYGFGKFSQLINQEHLHTSKIKNFSFENLEKINFGDKFIYIIDRKKYYFIGYNEQYSQEILYLFEMCFESFKLKWYYVPKERLIVFGDKEKGICAFICLKTYYHT